jgi:hypothetical protein
MKKHISIEQRRAFLKKAGTAAAAVPAAAILLSVAEKSALAQSQSGGIVQDPCELNPNECVK